MIVTLFLFFGVLGILFGGDFIQNIFLSLSALTLLIVYVHSFSNIYNRKERKKFQHIKKYLSFVMVITFLLEMLGANTGLLFGEYEYGPNIGIKIFETPVVIGFTWAIVIMGSIGLIEIFFGSKKSYFANKQTIVGLVYSVIVGTIATVFDFILEPAAIKMLLWDWKDGVVPLYNYISWFIISSCLGFLFYRKREVYIGVIDSRRYVINFVQVLFFLLIMNLFL